MSAERLRFRHFTTMRLREARAWASGKNQVAVHDTGFPYRSATGRVYAHTAHLFASDRETLLRAARVLNLNPRWLQCPGTNREHIDAFGTPLRRALALCERIDG